jgi:hypothetical protein
MSHWFFTNGGQQFANAVEAGMKATFREGPKQTKALERLADAQERTADALEGILKVLSEGRQ